MFSHRMFSLCWRGLQQNLFAQGRFARACDTELCSAFLQGVLWSRSRT